MATDPSAAFNIFSRAVERKALPDDPVLRADIEHVLEHGYVVLPECFTKAEAKEARDEIVRLLNKDGQALGGRNNFEGLNTIAYTHCSINRECTTNSLSYQEYWL